MHEGPSYNHDLASAPSSSPFLDLIVSWHLQENQEWMGASRAGCQAMSAENGQGLSTRPGNLLLAPLDGQEEVHKRGDSC